MAREEEINFGRSSQTNTTMIPGRFARAMRTNVIWQFLRFVVINLKMLVVVSKSH
jgi:hypothetical protein